MRRRSIPCRETILSALCRIRSSKRRKRRSPGAASALSGIHDGSMVGILTRTGTYSSDSGLRRMKPQLVDRFDMNGRVRRVQAEHGSAPGKRCGQKWEASSRWASVSSSQAAGGYRDWPVAGAKAW